MKLERKNLQLYLISCINISEYFNEDCINGIDYLSFLTGNMVTIEDILDMTKKIIIKSNFDLVFTNSYDFIIISKFNYNDNIINLAISILYSTIFTNLRFNYSKKSIALICMYMACNYYQELWKGEKIDNSFKYGYKKIITSLTGEKRNESSFRKKIKN